jgi:uncharacterized membrane protein YeaQ/YmgE (transglycosylase-associated protein family)
MTDGLGLKNGLLRLAAYALGLVGVVVGGVLALFFAATVVVLAVFASALIGATMLVMRARRTARAPAGNGVIEAQRVGHTWVAYGWNEPRR